MGEVVSFTGEHAEGVARVYMRAVRGQDRDPGKLLPRYFSDLHLNNPWARADMPALLYLEKGKVAGVLGVLPRDMRFDGRIIQAANVTLYMVDPEHRNGPAAIQLLRRALKGPQELLWTDGASGPVAALWGAMGGHQGYLYSLNWIRILRPLGTARSALAPGGAVGRVLKPLSGIVTTPGDLLLGMTVPFLAKPHSAFSATPVTAGELLGCIEEIGWCEKLRPSYSPSSFAWLMAEAAKSSIGGLRMATVSNADGERRGWFIYYAVPAGASFVLQVGMKAKDDARNVLLALFRDAWEQGSVYVKGAAIPQHLTAMTQLHCIFRHPYDRVVLHSRNREIADAIRTGEAAITRLDGIGWLRFSSEKWDQ